MSLVLPAPALLAADAHPDAHPGARPGTTSGRGPAAAAAVPDVPGWLTADVVPARDAALAALRDAVADGRTIVVAGHVAPDADALGGALALHLALDRLGAHSVVTVGEQPLKVPASLATLPGIDALVDADGLPAPEDVALLVTVDASSPDRLGTAADLVAAGVPTLVLDHHTSGRPFGDVRLVVPRVAASVQLVAHLVDALQVPLDVPLATCLYAGLVTDTGRFGHATTDADALRLAACLHESGVDHAGLVRRLYDTRSLGMLRLLGAALARVTTVPDVALVHTHVTLAELQAAGTGIEAVEQIVDLVRSADVAEVAAVLKPAGPGSWQVSLRSRGAVDVGALAASLGGGGHAAAAGFSAEGDAEDVVARVVARLRAG